MTKTILSLAFGVCIGMAGVAQVPFSQNFSGTTTGAITSTPPSGWTSTTTASVSPVIKWTFGDSATESSTYFAPPAHGIFAMLNSDSAGDAAGVPTQVLCDAWLKTPVITGIPAGTYLSFDYYFLHSSCTTYGGNSSPSLPYEIFVVHVSTDGGSTWAVLDSVPGITTNAWATTHVSLAAYSGMNIMLGFEYNNGSTWMNGAGFTNLNVYVPPTNSIEYYSITPALGTPASYTVAGDNISVSGQVINLGSSPITTFTAVYTDGTNTYTTVPTGLNVAAYDTASFTFTNAYNVALGSHPIKSWVSLAGATPASNDTLNTTLVGAAFLPTHQLTIEEAGGCWCGYCPRGIYYMDTMRVVHPTGVSLISVHDNTNGTDPMAVSVYDNGMVGLPGFTGFPTIAVERKELLDPQQIFQGYSDHASDFGYADLTLTTSSTGTTSISATATVKPAVDLNGTYQLALVLTEDNVQNAASTYEQHDYYSGGSLGYLTDQTIGVNFAAVYTNSFVPAASMKYNHVARSISTSFTGDPGSLPASMTAGTTYTYNFASTSMTAWNSTNLRAVLLLIDASTSGGVILNSVSTNMGLTSIAKNNGNITAVNLFPNPANSSFNMDVNLTKGEKTEITLFNVMGQAVSTNSYSFSPGENIVNIPTDQLSNGVYMVLVSSPSGVFQTKVNVIK